jgi:hypothetical protein
MQLHRNTSVIHRLHCLWSKTGLRYCTSRAQQFVSDSPLRRAASIFGTDGAHSNNDWHETRWELGEVIHDRRTTRKVRAPFLQLFRDKRQRILRHSVRRQRGPFRHYLWLQSCALQNEQLT